MDGECNGRGSASLPQQKYSTRVLRRPFEPNPSYVEEPGGSLVVRAGFTAVHDSRVSSLNTNGFLRGYREYALGRGQVLFRRLASPAILVW